MVFYNQPGGPGVWYLPGSSAEDQAGTIRVDTDAVPAGVTAIVVTASLDGAGPASFAVAEPVTVLIRDSTGAEASRFEIAGLGPETALVCVELYRRGSDWKVRAVGQGYASGLAGMATDFGVVVQQEGGGPAVDPPQAPPGGATEHPFAKAQHPPGSPRAAAREQRADATSPPKLDLRPSHAGDTHSASATAIPRLDLRSTLGAPTAPGGSQPPTLDMRGALAPIPASTATVPPAVDLRPSINLDRGKVTLHANESVSLVRTGAASLDRITMGLGWAPATSGDDIDLDASVVAVAEDGSLVDVVWFHNLTGCRGAIRHGGDNVVGSHTEADDECIYVDLGALPPSLKYLVFTVTSYSGQRFTDVREAYCRLLNGIGREAEELVRFTLSGTAPRTAALMCKLIRTGGVWQMTAIGRFYDGRTVLDLGEALDHELPG